MVWSTHSPHGTPSGHRYVTKVPCNLPSPYVTPDTPLCIHREETGAGGERRGPRLQTAVPFQRSRLVARETTPRSSTRHSSGHLPPSPLSPSLSLSLSLLSFISLVVQVFPDEKPYDATVPFWLNVYVAIHFVILLIIARVIGEIHRVSFTSILPFLLPAKSLNTNR